MLEWDDCFCLLATVRLGVLMGLVKWIAGGLALLMLLVLATFAMPVQTWRTGELPAPPLSLIEGGPRVPLSDRVWVDTDAACGLGRRTDPDDCLALFLLALSKEVEIIGISTVFGNAALEETDRVTRALADQLAETGSGRIPVYRGAAEATTAAQPAHEALTRALEEGPLTLVALGPLSNVAAVLRDRPDLQQRVVRLVAVMGRRPGHIFHPSEGAAGGILFGHGPVFRDLNFDLDREAARSLLAMGLPITFLPYEAARDVMLTPRDVDRIAHSGGAASWVADRTRGWLDFWRREIGREGFYPFDLLAAQYVLEPELFDCAHVSARVGKDERLRNLWFHEPDAMLIESTGKAPATGAGAGALDAEVVYCPKSRPSSPPAPSRQTAHKERIKGSTSRGHDGLIFNQLCQTQIIAMTGGGERHQWAADNAHRGRSGVPSPHRRGAAAGAVVRAARGY